MQNVLLLAAVAATFIFGWFLMGKLDCFLEVNRHAQESQFPSGENALRLGFCNPMVIDGITDALEQYSELHPNLSVCIFCGSEEELLKGLSACKLDVIFLPENTEIPAYIHYASKMVSLNYTSVMRKDGGLPIKPIGDGRIIQNMLWIGEAASVFTEEIPGR